ncbi:hypothetical protein ADUPG1_014245 [Aduncisulcus paluster]|uniref:Matrin-type domain-containing protein n=1 Tax=Aduncisulcus paluster TaxID=2918883 RepID=A0ABQ5KBC1_9EUKA|nr:hypothetical protein ADUPG1_014245 [Aduncisulcus paluster]
MGGKKRWVCDYCDVPLKSSTAAARREHCMGVDHQKAVKMWWKEKNKELIAQYVKKRVELGLPKFPPEWEDARKAKQAL